MQMCIYMYTLVTEVLQKSKYLYPPTSPSLIHPWAAPGICNLSSFCVQLPCVRARKMWYWQLTMHPFGRSQSKIIAFSRNVDQSKPDSHYDPQIYPYIMHFDWICLQQNATQMLRGNKVPSPWRNLPCKNMRRLHKIGLQMPWWRKWGKGWTILELGKQFSHLICCCSFNFS